MRTNESNLPTCNAQEIPLFVDAEGAELGKVNVLELVCSGNPIPPNTELIICLDASEGMHGHPFKAARNVIVDLRSKLSAGLSIAQTVTFAEGIRYHDMLRDDFADSIGKVEPEGKLNFLTLFKCLKDYIRTAEQTNVCVVVLSCGPNLFGSVRDMEMALNGLYEACSGKLVEFHTVGFGPENDVSLLRILSRMGSAGSYQYCATERDLRGVFGAVQQYIVNSGYSAELVSAEGVTTKFLRSYDLVENEVLFSKAKLLKENVLTAGAENCIKFRLYGADSSILDGRVNCDVVFRSHRGKLVFPLTAALKGQSEQTELTSSPLTTSRSTALKRIELLYLQTSSYAQQLSRRLPKSVILEHLAQFSKFAASAKDIYTKIMQFESCDKRICLFSMIRLFDYLAGYHYCLSRLSGRGEESELTFADLSILHSRGVFNLRGNSTALRIDIENRVIQYAKNCRRIQQEYSLQTAANTTCLYFLGKEDPVLIDSNLPLDTMLFAEDLAKHADLFGLTMMPTFDTRGILVPVCKGAESAKDDKSTNWKFTQENRKLIDFVYNSCGRAQSADFEFSLLGNMMRKLVDAFSQQNLSSKADQSKLLEFEKNYRLLLDTCVGLLKDNENEIKSLKNLFANYTNPGAEVRLPKHISSNRVFLMKLFAAFYGKIIPMEKSDKFVEKLNLLCLFMFEEEMRRALKNIPYVGRDYLWKVMNVDPEIYGPKLEEINRNKKIFNFSKRFGVDSAESIISAEKLFSAEFEAPELKTNNTGGDRQEGSKESPESKKSTEPMSYSSILSFNFSNDLQKHIDRFNLTEQLRDLMSIQSPQYQFILDFMSMCTGNTISTENNFGICSLAILLQNILQVNNSERGRAVLNSDFAAIENPEDIGFGTPYMFKVIKTPRLIEKSTDKSTKESTEDSIKNSTEKSTDKSIDNSTEPSIAENSPPETIKTYIDMVSVGCYDRAQLYIVFLLTHQTLEFLAKKQNEPIVADPLSVDERVKLFASCNDLVTAIEVLDGCKFGSDFSKYLDALLNSGISALSLDKLCMLVFGGFFFLDSHDSLDYKFVQVVDDIPADRKVSVGGLKVSAWKPNKQNIYKIWAKLGHLAPKDWWLQLFSHNKHAIECRYLAE